MIIKFKKLVKFAIEPSFGHPGDAGADLCSVENIQIEPGQYKQVKTGLAIEIPQGFVGLIWDKGSSPVRGWHTMAGVFDSGYRGEYILFLYNITDQPVTISKGEKIAQLLIQPIIYPTYKETNTMSDTSRGTGRLGSTGIK